MPVRLQQTFAVLLGLVLATAMVVLGYWQLRVYHAQGDRVAEQRAAAPAVALTTVAPAGQPVGDAYGRTVTMDGSYEPATQLLVPDPTAGYRVLTGLRQADGSIVAVVRGTVPTDAAPPAPPTGPVRQSGIFLPSEDAALNSSRDGGSSSAGQIDSVRVAQLAQTWRGPLIDGFVTLTPADASAQQLTAAVVDLPEARGRLRNGAYALQWWLFAGFTLVMSIRMARDFGRRELVTPVAVATPAGPPDQD